MRRAALAAITAVSLAGLAGVAIAKDWTDPAGRITFTTPNIWTQEVQNTADMTYLIVGTANNECQFVAVPRPETANSTARDVHRRAGEADAVTAEGWTTVANAVPSLFGGHAAVISQSVDTSNFWAIQRAELSGPDHPLIHGAIQIRPGLEIWTFCLSYAGADPVATYDAVIRSVATPRDAEWQTQATQQDAERAAAQAAADAAAAAAAAQHPPQQRPAQQPDDPRRHRDHL